ncbi:twin-arginine translocation signal domain-containing protein [Endozoicomonas sp. 4G]|uniref:twin-arginine translocation signal domain-containing protein n=1 Tax=Endozoicomonas sp. 4G TaxID=2872754 RepID=UPI002078F500|nr:twin-arginine translocation signal domain-containing protein [Endozoicomonas sp. 4G]
MMKRRDFLKSGPIAAAAAVASGTCLASDSKREDVSKYAPTSLSPEFKVNSSGELEANPDQRMAFSMCFGCYSTCAVRARIDNASDQVVRVAGNPYGAAALTTPMDLATPPGSLKKTSDLSPDFY